MKLFKLALTLDGKVKKDAIHLLKICRNMIFLT